MLEAMRAFDLEQMETSEADILDGVALDECSMFTQGRPE